MEVSFMRFQLTGRPVDDISLNQFRNVGGSVPSFFVEFYSCESFDGEPHVLSTVTTDSLVALDAEIDRSLGKVLFGVTDRVPCSNEVRDRKRGIVMEA